MVQSADSVSQVTGYTATTTKSCEIRQIELAKRRAELKASFELAKAREAKARPEAAKTQAEAAKAQAKAQKLRCWQSYVKRRQESRLKRSLLLALNVVLWLLLEGRGRNLCMVRRAVP